MQFASTISFLEFQYGPGIMAAVAYRLYNCEIERSFAIFLINDLGTLPAGFGDFPPWGKFSEKCSEVPRGLIDPRKVKICPQCIFVKWNKH